jgi:hypothetical protein
MADDRHDDASQEGGALKHPLATDIKTTGSASEAPDQAASELADGAAGNAQDNASKVEGWQAHSSAADLEADRTAGMADESGSGDADRAPGDQQFIPQHPVAPPPRSRVLPAVFGAFSGAIAAGLVIGGAWLADWPPPSSEPQVSSAQFGDLSNRVADIESKAGKPAAPASDPAAAARIEALEKSVASLRDELTAVRGQSDKLAAGLKDGAAAAGDGGDAPDLAAINARLAQVEHQVEQTKQTLAAEATRHEPVVADDVPLRRAMAATLLNVAVRQGQPYGDLLAASKALIANPETLKPLEVFADSGVPSANALCRELLAVVPKIAPAPLPVMATTGSSIVNRLQEGAARLVHIERIDGSHTESASATVARIAASARQNDIAAAKAELKTLPSADRSAADPWIARADAYDAALAASRQFAADAMTALTKPAP